LIHDRDPVFTTTFGEVFKSEGLRTITTLLKTPWMNAICERVNGTLRRELLDRILVVGERHLALVFREYACQAWQRWECACPRERLQAPAHP
jgi:putative transposase